jgi:hypothetical protein
MSLHSWSRSHRIASMWVVALLAANGAVLVTGLADAVSSVVEQAKPRTITLITTKDGKQIAVDPTTPEGWKAVADAEQRGDTVSTVPVPDAAVAASKGDGGNPAVTIPGVSAGDLQNLLTGTVDHIVTTVSTIVDSTGQTVVSIVDGVGSTVSSVVDEAGSTVSSVVDTATSTVSSIVDSATTLPTVPTTIPTVTVPTTVPVVTVPTTVPALDTTVTTIQNTVTTLQNTVTTLLGSVPTLPPPTVPSLPGL